MAVDTPFETRTALTIKNAQAIPEDGGTAVVSTKTALVRQPKDGTERLKRYRWTKGRSGNPGGRPKKLPLSEGLRAVLDMPVSAQVKSELEKAVDGTLPEEFTWTDAIVLGHVLDTFSKLKGFKPEAAREIRLAVEGRETQRIEVADAPTHTEDDITRHLWTKLGGYEYERCKLFNLPVPENTLAMAKSMGVKLELPPCQLGGAEEVRRTLGRSG